MKERKIDRTTLTVILLVATGVLLLLFSVKERETEVKYTDVQFYTEYLEGRVAKLCQSVAGIEEAVVFLTMDCSSEYVYREEGASDVIILTGSGGEDVVMLREIYPKVRGVAVVCTGGDLPRVQETVTELLSAALELPSHRIRVAGN